MPDYDIFISYPRENVEWVTEQLYAPLLHCRLPTGRRPKIFLDIDEIKIGAVWAEALMGAIQACRYFIPVYSDIYFQKPMCQWELQQAWKRDPVGNQGILMPILLDRQARVPELYQLIQYILVKPDKDWFGELCQQMKLVYAKDIITLSFTSQPTDTHVNNTLNPLYVEVRENDNLSDDNHKLIIESSTASLQGTLELETQNGTAVFKDLSISEPATEIYLKLRLSTNAAKPVQSSAFSILPAPPTLIEPDPLPDFPQSAGDKSSLLNTIPRSIRPPVFLEDNQTFAVFATDGLRFFLVDGTCLTEKPVPLDITEPRLIRQNHDTLYLADWFGKIQAVDKTGRIQSWDLRAGQSDDSWTIVAEIISQGNEICAAVWNGTVYRLLPDAQKESLFQHDGGIQCVHYQNNLFIVVDFDGQLHIYEDGHLVDSVPIDNSVAYLCPCANYLLAFGDTANYQIQIDSRPPKLELQKSEHNLSLLLGTLAGTKATLVVDVDGRGFQFNKELHSRSMFRTVPNAKPIAADRDGRFCVLANPDGSYSLVRENKIVFSTSSESIVVSPRGNYFIFSGDSGIRILNYGQLEQHLKG